MEIRSSYDVFISYHGGQGDDEKSSYGMAEKLYDYLEGHNLKCFLCKKENANDFYDAISAGILRSKHFVLVACNADMLSQWVKDEVKQFDGLIKNGQKNPNAIIAACIFGKITEKELYNFNPLFATKDVVFGENDFEKIYRRIMSASALNFGMPVELEKISFEETSKRYLSGGLATDGVDTKEHNRLLTSRLKCMVKTTVPENCDDFVGLVYDNLKKCPQKNLLKVMGQSGAQKSYLLQLLYLHIKKNEADNDFDPVYIHCSDIKADLRKKKLDSEEYIEQLFASLVCRKDRKPLFIVDGIYDVVVDKYKLDYIIKKKIDEYFPEAELIVGITTVFGENKIRLNKSVFMRAQYEKIVNLSYVSLYDKQKCLLYLSTLKGLPVDSTKLYDLLNRSGLLFINEQIVKIFCSGYEYDASSNIMDIFETELLNYLDGDYENLKNGAKMIFEFAYGDGEIDYENALFVKMINKVCDTGIYLNCLIAIHFLDNLENYGKTNDFSFFNVILPKEVTRFVVYKVQSNPKYEDLFISLGLHYNEMSLMGKSEMSFFLGRLKTERCKEKAIELLNRYYIETKNEIKKYDIDTKYNNVPYSYEVNKQNLFLLRGISVSLIYCGNRDILYEYIHSLISDDLSNSINRGFHLEYYGDKRYLPNQQTLDYEDNPRTGERTLRILCNSIDNHINSANIPLSTLLEVFTVVSLLQVRIQQDRKSLSFNLIPFVERGLAVVKQFLEKVSIKDNIIICFFAMAQEDFNNYLQSKKNAYLPELDICNTYLDAMTVKRTGWVLQAIPGPESIVEHMYSCWFIGLIYLPNSCSEIQNYNKSAILNMLLIHDLAETKLSDIPKYEKKMKYPDFDERENVTMLSMLLKGTYDNIDVMEQFVSAWDEWYNQSTQNARIAKDIDTIQAIYQFLVYKNDYPDNFDEERSINWLNELNCIQTATGKSLAKKIIVDNERFYDVIQKYAEVIPMEMR